MDRCIQEVICILCNVNLQTCRQAFFCLADNIKQIIDCFSCIGSCHLEYDTGYSLMTVYCIIKGIGQTSQLDTGNISQTENFSIRQRFNNDVFEFFRLLQTSLITDGILERLITTFTELSGCGFDVLFCQYTGNIRRYQVILCHNIRFQPDTHGVILSHHIGITHTFHTLNFRNQVDLRVVFNKLNVIFIFCIVQREDQQHRVLTFLSSYTDFGYFGRQQTLCHRNTVLNVNRSHIRISTLVKIYTDICRTIV